MKRAALLALALAACEAKAPEKIETPAPTPAAAPAPSRFANDDVVARASAPAGAPEAAAKPASRDPAELFNNLGCKNCHRTGAAYHQNIVNARTKPEQEIAAWIRFPQKVKPTTAMPSFATLLSDDDALALARWIKAGNPQ